MMKVCVGDDGHDVTHDGEDGDVIENDNMLTMTISMVEDDEQHSENDADDEQSKRRYGCEGDDKDDGTDDDDADDERW